MELEKYIEANKSLDMYINEIDLAIEIDGPTHFFARSGERIKTVQDRRTDRVSRPLRIHYRIFDPYCGAEVDFTQYDEADFADLKI